jgi:hypothetical protein
MKNAAAWSVDLLMIVLCFWGMNQSITTIISYDIILLYKCTDEYRTNRFLIRSKKGYDWWDSNIRRPTIGWIQNYIVRT